MWVTNGSSSTLVAVLVRTDEGADTPHRNLTAFLLAARDAGLLVSLRIGPYGHGEVRGGGKKPRFVAPRSVPSGHAQGADQGKAPSMAAPPPVQPRAAPVMPEPSHCVCTQSVADWVPLHLRSCPCCCPSCNRPLARNGELVLHATHCLNVDINATLLKR